MVLQPQQWNTLWFAVALAYAQKESVKETEDWGGGLTCTHVNIIPLTTFLFQANVLMRPEHSGGMGGGLSPGGFAPSVGTQGSSHTFIHLPSWISSHASLYAACFPLVLNCLSRPYSLRAFPHLPLYSCCVFDLGCFAHLCRSKAYSIFDDWFKDHLLLNLSLHSPLPGSDLSLP